MTEQVPTEIKNYFFLSPSLDNRFHTNVTLEKCNTRKMFFNDFK